MLSIHLRASLRTVATEMLILLAISYQVRECSAQATDGLHNSVQRSARLNDAANTGTLVSVTQSVSGGSNSTATESAKKATKHSVTLSWNPSIPAAKSGAAIIGYIVYRSTKSGDRDAKPINVTQISGTTFVDSNVEPGKAYYYVARAVSASGKLSGPSNEARAEIPADPPGSRGTN